MGLRDEFDAYKKAARDVQASVDVWAENPIDHRGCPWRRRVGQHGEKIIERSWESGHPWEIEVIDGCERCTRWYEKHTDGLVLFRAHGDTVYVFDEADEVKGG